MIGVCVERGDKISLNYEKQAARRERSEGRRITCMQEVAADLASVSVKISEPKQIVKHYSGNIKKG